MAFSDIVVFYIQITSGNVYYTTHSELKIPSDIVHLKWGEGRCPGCGDETKALEELLFPEA